MGAALSRRYPLGRRIKEVGVQLGDVAQEAQEDMGGLGAGPELAEQLVELVARLEQAAFELAQKRAHCSSLSRSGNASGSVSCQAARTA